MALRDDILAGPKRASVDLEFRGCEVRVVGPSLEERLHWADEEHEEPVRWVVEQIVGHLVDPENGELIFGPDDVGELLDMDDSYLMPLFAAWQTLCSGDDAEGN